MCQHDLTERTEYVSKKSLQEKKHGKPIPRGVKFAYIGKPGPGVVTVAWAETTPGRLRMAFSFCSPADPWCKETGRNIAVARLFEHSLNVRYLYSPKRIVHEVARAILAHDFVRLAGCLENEHLLAAMQVKGHFPSWTKDLAKRMETRRVSGISKLFRFRRPDTAQAIDALHFALCLDPFGVHSIPRREEKLQREFLNIGELSETLNRLEPGKSLGEKVAAMRREAVNQEATRLEADATHERLLRHKASHAPKYTPVLSLNSLFRILADIDTLGR